MEFEPKQISVEIKNPSRIKIFLLVAALLIIVSVVGVYATVIKNKTSSKEPTKNTNTQTTQEGSTTPAVTETATGSKSSQVNKPPIITSKDKELITTE